MNILSVSSYTQIELESASKLENKIINSIYDNINDRKYLARVALGTFNNTGLISKLGIKATASVNICVMVIKDEWALITIRPTTQKFTTNEDRLIDTLYGAPAGEVKLGVKKLYKAFTEAENHPCNIDRVLLVEAYIGDGFGETIKVETH